MSDGAHRSAAVSVVVTPLTLSKSLSVQMATFISGRLWHSRRGSLDQVEQQRTVEPLLEDEMSQCRCQRERNEGQSKQAANDEGLTLPVERRARQQRDAIHVEAGREPQHVRRH